MDWKNVVPKDGHVDISQLTDVEYEPLFDFHDLEHSAEWDRSLCPPFLFEPMESRKLEESPLDPAEARAFFDIDKNKPLFPLGPMDRVEQISSLLEDRATTEAESEQGLQVVESPFSTFWLDALLSWPYGKSDWWDTQCVREPCPKAGKVFPHLAFHLIDEKAARDGSILFSEFSALVIAMRGRANQRKVDSEDKREELWENDGEGKEDYPYLFKDEEYFPVLVVSCVLPQHARLLTACMNQRKLVIRQSKLYSFEHKKTAPVDFFTRLFLSKPLEPRREAEFGVLGPEKGGG
ncbi:hypothetical protein BDQ94DRAFT_165534 [Aspergillus welwitschiae]|uniref:Uncharacterized protein n=1 Tax=Aspergillus welwitschiae TaxID=1341132 RepID=A0A3F3QHF6_9EURO|nr:hypothetical protein BDQ94DRAFT_165534 [Aspergillus welwitschiae]RDH38389.1 hypothetical protein BDQ94DRAFT_165534 [Aspergillus welwitschiae]